MRYVLMIRADENANVSEEVRAARAAADRAFAGRTRDRGPKLDGMRLQPAADATTVRCWHGGDIAISTGPFGQPAEQITGCIVADCDDLDAAIELATTIPAAWYGAVEIRETMDIGL